MARRYFCRLGWLKISRLIFTPSTEIRRSSGSERKFGSTSGIAAGSAERKLTEPRDLGRRV
jgi:hypothetical protein